MKPIGSAIFALALLPMAALGGSLPEPEGRVLVTVAGDLPAGNVAPLPKDAVNVSGFLGITYDKAVGFDERMLDGLQQHQITARLLDSGREVVYSGPRLSDVLRAVGAEGKTAVPTALDGYQAELDWETITKFEPILATHADGKPLEIGKLGPAMVVFPVIDDAETYATFNEKEVFATFHIAVQ